MIVSHSHIGFSLYPPCAFLSTPGMPLSLLAVEWQLGGWEHVGVWESQIPKYRKVGSYNDPVCTAEEKSYQRSGSRHNHLRQTSRPSDVPLSKLGRSWT